MIREHVPFDLAVRRLAAREAALDEPGLALLLRLCAYREGHLATVPDGLHRHPSLADAAFGRARAVRASLAALARPACLEAGAAPHVPAMVNGIDLGPAALRAFVEEQVAFVRDAFGDGSPAHLAADVSDAGSPVPIDTAGFERRWLRLCLLAAVDPEAHRRLATHDPGRTSGAALVARWWSERLGRAASDAQAKAFERSLRATLALTGIDDTDVDYAPDALLAEALDAAGLAAQALDGCRKSAAWFRASDGRAFARLGDGEPVVELGRARAAA